MPILKTEDSQCGTKSKDPAKPTGLTLQGQGTTCAAEAPSHTSPSKTTTVLGEHLSQLSASSLWADLWPAAVSGVLEIPRPHCEKMLTTFPKEMQLWMQVPVSSLHAQLSALCRHGCIAMNRWSRQKLSSGENKVGMESGNIWEWENEKQVWPGTGHRRAGQAEERVAGRQHHVIPLTHL